MISMRTAGLLRHSLSLTRPQPTRQVRKPGRSSLKPNYGSTNEFDPTFSHKLAQQRTSTFLRDLSAPPNAHVHESSIRALQILLQMRRLCRYNDDVLLRCGVRGLCRKLLRRTTAGRIASGDTVQKTKASERDNNAVSTEGP